MAATFRSEVREGRVKLKAQRLTGHDVFLIRAAGLSFEYRLPLAQRGAKAYVKQRISNLQDVDVYWTMLHMLDHATVQTMVSKIVGKTTISALDTSTITEQKRAEVQTSEYMVEYMLRIWQIREVDEFLMNGCQPASAYHGQCVGRP